MTTKVRLQVKTVDLVNNWLRLHGRTYRTKAGLLRMLNSRTGLRITPQRITEWSVGDRSPGDQVRRLMMGDIMIEILKRHGIIDEPIPLEVVEKLVDELMPMDQPAQMPSFIRRRE